ncbi:glycosyltransferase family 2 protein [Dactylosporangium sp. CA-139114]|uniref:glycosyltransferase family 2 protein n=1 Tax=Dactylosporangium sp. CA-139114 TaxID=3239931 RepID=UPI003D969924
MNMLGIAIVNYRSADDTAALVRSIVAHHDDPNLAVAIAIVDNSDEPAEVAPIAEHARRCGMVSTVLHGHGNVGYAAGNNLAASWLLGQGAGVVWVLNPDTRIVAGRLTAAFETLRCGGPVIAATTSAAPDGSGHPDLGAIDLWTGRSGRPAAGVAAAGRTLTYVAGHSVLVNRDAWLALGGFSEDFFLFFEEADLAVRSARLGIPTTVVAGLTVEHAGGGSTGATADLRAKSQITYFHASRSCMIFFRKHHRKRVPAAFAARLAYAARVLPAGGPAAASAVVRGAIAGLRA